MIAATDPAIPAVPGAAVPAGAAAEGARPADSAAPAPADGGGFAALVDAIPASAEPVAEPAPPATGAAPRVAERPMRPAPPNHLWSIGAVTPPAADPAAAPDPALPPGAPPAPPEPEVAAALPDAADDKAAAPAADQASAETLIAQPATPPVPVNAPPVALAVAPLRAAEPAAAPPTGDAPAPAAKTRGGRLASASATERAPAGHPPQHIATVPAEAGDFRAALDGSPAGVLSPVTAQSDRSAAHLSQAAAPESLAPATVTVRPGQIGHDMGVAIAREVSAGRDEFLLRLNPAEHGHIAIRMRFEDDGSLRAVVTADSSAVLDMLRKESGDLGRALGDAGIRTDPQSFRFDTGGEGARGQGGQRYRPASTGGRDAAESTDEFAAADFRPMRGGLGLLNRFA